MDVDEAQEPSSAPARRTARSVSSKLQVKLKRAIEENNFYEAHQIYRTIYARTVGAEKLPEILCMLKEGALMLLRNGQLESGADLAMLYLDALEKKCSMIPSEHVDVVADFHRHMHRETPERQKFLARALKLSASSRQTSLGSPELHAAIARNLWEEKDYVAARYHFLRSNDGQGCGLMLVEFHVTLGYSSEADLFIAQTVFQSLCLMKDTGVANVTLAAYCGNHPSLRDRSGPPYYLPLLNFVWLLLLTIQSRTLTWFSILCDKYKPVLSCDPSYFEYLDRIGQIFFGLRPPAPQRPGGIFGNLMDSLFTSLADTDESDEEPRARSSTRNAPALQQTPRQLVHEDDLD